MGLHYHCIVHILMHCMGVYLLCSTKPLDTAIPPKIVQLERERAEKWGKMLTEWDKYEKSDRVMCVCHCVCVCVCVLDVCMCVRVGPCPLCNLLLVLPKEGILGVLIDPRLVLDVLCPVGISKGCEGLLVVVVSWALEGGEGRGGEGEGDRSRC